MTGGVGFYGKLPGAGDFVQRRLAPAFIDDWDRHFQRAVETGRRELGEQWTQAWKQGAAWRFMLPAQVCGQGAWCGLVGPAVDRLGRAFPLVLAAPCSGDVTAILSNDAWFDALERIYRSALYDAVSVETFDARVAALAGPSTYEAGIGAIWRALPWDSGQWMMTPPAGAATGIMLAQTWTQLSLRPGPWCLWWTASASTLLATRGLPRSYATLLEHRAEQPGETASLSIPDSGSERGLQPVHDVDVAVDMQPAMPSLDDGRMLVLCADDGPDMPGRLAAYRIREAARTVEGDLDRLRSALMELHAQLRVYDEASRDETPENGAALIARFEGAAVRLLRFGAASAWLWRYGELHPLFVERAAGAGGEFDDLLFGDTWIDMPGIGAAGEPDCDEAHIVLEHGDRLLLLVTRGLVQLPRTRLAEALGLSSHEDARIHLAVCAGLSGRSELWPLAVIGVGA
jgi:type VI secretion system protein ImpM